MTKHLRLAPEPSSTEIETLATERLEADICQLAGNIAAAECRFLILVGEYDARGGYASWDMPSCAAWLAWKCQLSPGTADIYQVIIHTTPGALADVPAETPAPPGIPRIRDDATSKTATRSRHGRPG
jgi:hypothetical protein